MEDREALRTILVDMINEIDNIYTYGLTVDEFVEFVDFISSKACKNALNSFLYRYPVYMIMKCYRCINDFANRRRDELLLYEK